jgi:hypothetical protein
VAFINPFGDAPSRLSRSRILAVWLPARASGLAAFGFVRLLYAFLAGLALLPDLVLVGV